MAITLSDGVDTITLHPDLYWSDENNWHPVEQSVQRSITGALIVQAVARTDGRPITLEPEDDSSGWIPRSTVVDLRNWAAEPGKEMTLTLNGVSHNVLFRHQDGGLESRPVIHYNNVVDADWHLCVLRFMEIP